MEAGARTDRLRSLTVSPSAFAWFAYAALAALFLIVVSGATVRLTGSGLGCENWPRCGDHIVAPLQLHAWIEFGNRIVTFLVSCTTVAAFVLSFRRTPRRRDLIIASAILPIGVLAQAILGGLAVLFELKPGFVMGHFGLSMLVLVSAVVLYWRASHEPGAPGTHDRRLVLLMRVLMAWGAFVLFAGTVATAAGPHPGATTDHAGGVVPRITWMTLDALIHWHARAGTVLGVLAVATWFVARRAGASSGVRRALTWVCCLVAAQGIIGFAQYELALPAGLVWIHVAVASATWLAIVVANAAVGRLAARTSTAAHPQFWGADPPTSVEQASANPS